MGGPSEVEHHVIGQVDQRRDRPLPSALEALLQPLRRRTVPEAPHDPAEESRTALRVLRRDRHRALEAALDFRHVERLELAHARGGEVAGNAAHAHAVLAVGGDGDIEDDVVELRPFGIGHTDRRVVGQVDNALMLIAQLQLADRAHHASRFDAANRRDLQSQVAAWHVSPRRPEDSQHAGPCIGRAAHDLHRPVTGIDAEHLQFVRLRMALGAQHPGDAERTQRLGRVGQTFDLQADIGQLVGDLVRQRVRLEMRL